MPLYATILSDICPSPKEDFDNRLVERLSKAKPDLETKAIRNHITEMSRTLLGMWYEDEEVVRISPRVSKYLLSDSSADQPAFFKDLLYKYQTPNGADSPRTAKQRLQDGIRFRNYCAIVSLLLSAHQREMKLVQREIAYYFLNAKDVLCGRANNTEVLDQIVSDRRAGIKRRVHNAGRPETFNTQHIREQLKLLELANLVRFNRVANEQEISLNLKEMSVLQVYASAAQSLPFSITLGELNTESGQARNRWQAYFASISKEVEPVALTDIASLNEDTEAELGLEAAGSSEIGAAGENYVYAYEKRRVGAYKRTALSRVKLVANVRGLGYDVHSVRAEAPNPDHSIHIEVKSTKRVTLPDLSSEPWSDSFTLTRNEWEAADTHKGAYLIYRVYFTRDKTVIHRIEDPVKMIKPEPLTYRAEYEVSTSVVREMPDL